VTHHCLLALTLLAAACGESREAQRVKLPVRVDGAGAAGPVTTDLGWSVSLTRLALAVEGLDLTTAGELHAGTGLLPALGRLLVPPVQAHAGHAAGGEVIGELPGPFVIDWVGEDGRLLGEATLLEGDYNGANLTFGRAEELGGHTGQVEGRAERDGETVELALVVDQDAGRQVVGAPFDLDVATGTTVTLKLQVLLEDPVEGDTLFDGIDFAETEAAEQASRLRRALQKHDHYRITTEAP